MINKLTNKRCAKVLFKVAFFDISNGCLVRITVMNGDGTVQAGCLLVLVFSALSYDLTVSLKVILDRLAHAHML